MEAILNPPVRFIEEVVPEKTIECICGSHNVSEKYHASLGFSFQGCRDCHHVWRTS